MKRLPIAPKPAPVPTVDAMRRKLGGRIAGPAARAPSAEDRASLGAIVAVTTSAGLARTGAVVFALGDDVDVAVPELEGLRHIVIRAKRSALQPAASASPVLARLAADARSFGELAEGQRVAFRSTSGRGEGTLVEKCRFGAIVLREGATLVAVGFQRVSADPQPGEN